MKVIEGVALGQTVHTLVEGVPQYANVPRRVKPGAEGLGEVVVSITEIPLNVAGLEGTFAANKDGTSKNNNARGGNDD